ncbi:MAG: M28 family peptidase [Actinobacteria bacterium]|uniref:Unannotated protein n=1 Tax=freshwater metagenome TaxID=449393 RepID=A0A6J6NYI8_9ZZZZ|nr:M28 family peptidase [Actinomycetota bacterium]
MTTPLTPTPSHRQFGRRALLAAAPAGVLGAAAASSAPAAATQTAAVAGTHDALLPSAASMMRTIEHLVSIAPRKTGTPGGRKAAEYVASRLRAAGMDKVWIEKSTSYSWEATEASLVVGGQKIDQTPISYSLIGGPEATGVRTLGPQGLQAEVVDLSQQPLSALSRLDVRGKIVMIDLIFLTPLLALSPLMEFLNDPSGEILDAQTLLTANPYITTLPYTIDALQAAGAAGMIGVLSDYFDSNKYHNEYYRRSPMEIPGMWITAGEAVRVRSLLDTEPTATMRLTTRRRKVVARQPIGVIEGRTKDTIMVQSHHDSMGPGAVEDGSGTSEVLALAEYYGALHRRGIRRDKTLMFTTFDTHFTGYQAHDHFGRKYVLDEETPYRIVANDTIEHIAKKGRVGPDGELLLLDEVEPRGFFEDLSIEGKSMIIQTILRHDLRATTMLNAQAMQPVGIPTDASWAVICGVPTVSLIAGPIYLYDEADTIDAIAQDELVPILKANRDIIDWFEQTPSERIGLVAVPPLT